jgi:TolA-binding protein
MWLRKHTLAFVLICLSALIARPSAAEQEILLTDAELQKLERFEATNLLRGEKAFNAKNYEQAAIEYDAFTSDFPSSPLIAYAQLRKGRSLQLGQKRNKAIKAYNEVIDNYKESVNYAGAALYYTGECHFDNGDQELAVKAWRRMVDNPGYNKTFLAATAINRLADHYLKQKQYDQASTCYEQTAIDFRDSNPEAARTAIQHVIDFRVRLQPDEGKLRAFYQKVRGFEGNPIAMPPDVAADHLYWERLRQFIKERGNFGEKETEAKAAYYQYWATAFDGKFADWDDFQVDAANFRLAATGDLTGWTDRLEQQFKNGKTDDNARLIKWVHVFATHKAKAAEYFGKINLDTLDNAQLQELMRICFDEAKDAKLGRKAFEKLKLDKWNDEQKTNCAWNVLLFRDEASYVEMCESISDKEVSQVLLLRYYHNRHETPAMYKKAMDLADELKTSQRYSQEAFWMKAELYHWQGKFAEAIQAYTAADRPPDTQFRIGECYVAMGKIDAAVQAYHEVEFIAKNRGAEAAWRIACLYKNNPKEYIPKLHAITHMYPNSGESSNAHLELEKLHVDVGGAVIDEKK